MKRCGKLITAVVMLLGSVAPFLHAATEQELAAEVGRGRAAEWSVVFSEELSSLARSAHVSTVAYTIALRALSDETLGGSPGEAAHLVFSLCLGVDRALRRGTPPGEVLLEARESAHLAAVSGNANVLRGSARARVQTRLMNMGGQISGDMGDRLGPQRGQGAGMTSGTPGGGPVGGLPGTPSGAGGGSGSPKR